MDPKYTVIKTQDWEDFLDGIEGRGPRVEWLGRRLVDIGAELPIDNGYFVVREQDVFAPAGLYAYAANIHSAIEFQDALGPSVMEEEVRERLLVFADELNGLADKWKASNTTKKVPD